MRNQSPIAQHIQFVENFQELVSAPFLGDKNAICWKRELIGNFAEIVEMVSFSAPMITLEEEYLMNLNLSKQGQLAREILLADFNLLKQHGALPTLNIIEYYERDNDYPFFPTDVYSFHVDGSPMPADTFLCTYYGEASEILPNAQAQQKIHIPEIRAELKKLYDGAEEGFESFLSEYFFDMHYAAKPNSTPINLGLGNLWKLAIDHPERQSLPSIHRAPLEKSGQKRLLLIC